MKPVSVCERMVAVAAAITMTTGMAAGLAAMAGHHPELRTGATGPQAGIACRPARIQQSDAAVERARTIGS